MPGNSGLTPEEQAIYQWQLWVPDFGVEGQERLKQASVLVSRCGGVGSVVAYELAAAGIGRLILAHGGKLKPSDLNRQILMTHDWIGKPRIESATRRLKELNPRLEVVSSASNVTEQNAEELVSQADVVVDCAPIFEERFLMNRQAVLQGKPIIECAMYEMEAQITTILPGQTPCLQCLYPELPPGWKREFPVLGAVSGTVGCLAAVETIKLIANLGEPLLNRHLSIDLRSMNFRIVSIRRNPDCSLCGSL
jgi:molybdopterin/thiamine biosynthesis adenylyltransferase